MLLPTRGQRLCAPDRDQFLRQPDTAVIRTDSVAIFTRFCLRRSIASHGTIAKLVGLLAPLGQPHKIYDGEPCALSQEPAAEDGLRAHGRHLIATFRRGFGSGTRTKSAIFHPLVRLTSQETAEGGFKSGTRFHLSRVTRLSRKVLIGLGYVTALSLPYRTSLQGRRGTPVRTSVPAAQRRRRVAACSGFEMLRPLGIGNRPGLLRLPPQTLRFDEPELHHRD
jgi:hypothetical protein